MFLRNLTQQKLTKIAVVCGSTFGSLFAMGLLAGEIFSLFHNLDALNDPFFPIIFVVFPIMGMLRFMVSFAFAWSLTILLGKVFYKSHDDTKIKHIILALVGLVMSAVILYVYLGIKILSVRIKHVRSNSQLEQIAKSPLVKINAKFYFFNSGDLAKSITEHPYVSPVALERLWHIHDEYVDILVAGNTSTPQYILENLGAADDINTKEQLAKNPNTPPAVLERLYVYADPILIGRDKSKDGRFDYGVSVARGIIQNLLKNPSTPKYILENINKSYELYFKVIHY